jgi:D-beta-D-heptose 7-phosphate kinase/D-beta-D-heptose 1-phosphate adenosyltransferase
MNSEIIRTFLESDIKKCRVLVVGDVMLDQYFYGDVIRISPEAPVPVNRINRQEDTLGGAANVAHNLARLGCKTYLCGVVGRDYHCAILKDQLKEIAIESVGMINGRDKTTTKVRILGGHQQMIRLDFEETNPIQEQIEEKILKYVEEKIKAELDCIIISDYQKGFCTGNICQQIIRYAHESNVTVLVDPKGSDWERYQNADYVTPNLKELSDIIGTKVKNENQMVKEAVQLVRDKFGVSNIIVTRSEKGLSLFEGEKVVDIPTVAQDVFDVSGAGDTVIAVFAAAISGNIAPQISAEIANLAAGIGVGKVGTYAVSAEEILTHIS